MIRLRNFLRDDAAAGAAEFALVLPLFLIFLLGTIDAGRFAWEFNRAAKATQTGARWAVATDIVPLGLDTYSYAISGGVTQGAIVPLAKFPGVECTSTAGTPACSCKPGGTCDFLPGSGATANATAWAYIVTRMQQIYPAVTSDNVQIDYDRSGLGFAGDPNGPDVAPLTTVTLKDMQFQPLTLILFGGTLPIPKSSYALTMEDGDGTYSN